MTREELLMKMVEDAEQLSISLFRFAISEPLPKIHKSRLRYFVPREELAVGMVGDLPAPLGKRADSKATLVSSLTKKGTHRPVLDIDFEASLVPSSTPGHYHLYLDGIELSWRQYRRLLKALAKAGVIQRGYYCWSVRRGQSTVRLPWVKKMPEELSSPYEPKVRSRQP